MGAFGLPGGEEGTKTEGQEEGEVSSRAATEQGAGAAAGRRGPSDAG